MIVNNDDEMREAFSQFKGLVSSMEFNVEYPVNIERVTVEIQGDKLVVNKMNLEEL